MVETLGVDPSKRAVQRVAAPRRYPRFIGALRLI
jgi:hypothetical protein